MKINKNCIADFARKQHAVALATKSRLFDTSFSVTSELIVYDLKTKKQIATKSEHKFCSVKWCESTDSLVAVGHDNGSVSVYALKGGQLDLAFTKQYAGNSDEVAVLDFLPQKNMLAACTQGGKLFFVNLTDSKEYALDVQIPGPSCMAWNSSVSKIIAIGTNDGSIRLVDIKKHSVIMTLTEFRRVKRIEWDEVVPTKLVVQSERSHLSMHELSSDTQTETESFEGGIVSFCGDHVLAGGFLVNLKTGARIPMRDEVKEAVLSERTAVLNNKDGSTDIYAIPRLPLRAPHFRVGNVIYAPGGTFSVSSSHSLDYETKEEKVDSFYDELRDHANTAEHLIENADGINPAYLTNTAKSGIAVDVTNQMHRRLLKGDFGALRESKETISLSNVASLVENDKAVLDKVKSFDELMLLSKLLGDYSRLYRINNSRLLAALLLNLNLDLAPLNGTDREGRILKGALTGDSSIVGDRIVLSGNFYENMSKIKQLLGDLNTPVESDYLSEYFWYKVSIGEYEDVADLKVNDTRIQQYKDGFRQINELTAKLNTVVAPSGIGKFTRPPIGMSRPQQAQNALRMAPKSPVMAPRSPASVPGRPLPKSPVMGSSQQRPIGQGSQPQTRPLPSKPMTPAFGTRPIGQNRPVMPGRPGIGGMGKTPFMNKPMTPPFGQKSESATNRESVFREFSILVEQVKQQVATKNSILINQKKTRFLNGLATYNSVDSATITDEVAGAMESIVQRMKNIDSRLKTDLDAMGVNKTVWLQSLVELIKIGY